MLNAQLLRVPRGSQDVDVLVDPTGFDAMIDELSAIGWYPYFQAPTAMQWMPAHAVSLKHAAWPCALDVHRFFPGCLAPPQQVFDELWVRRSSVRLGGRDVPCPDVAGSAVVAGLHGLRAPDSWREKAELVYLTSELGRRLDEAERADLAALASLMGARDTLGPMLEALGVAPEPASTGPEAQGSADALADWHLRRASGRYPTLMRLEEVRRTSWRRVPGVLWHALLLTEDEIRYTTPDMPAGRWGLARGRLKRIRRVLPQIPGAALYLAKNRGAR